MSPEDGLQRTLLRLLLIYGVLPFTFGRTERSLSKLREVQAPVDLSTAIRGGVAAQSILRSCRKLRNSLSPLGSSLLRMHPASIGATIHLMANASKEGLCGVFDPYPVGWNRSGGSRGDARGPRPPQSFGLRFRPKGGRRLRPVGPVDSIHDRARGRSAAIVGAGRAVRQAVAGHGRPRADQLPRHFRWHGAGTELSVGGSARQPGLGFIWGVLPKGPSLPARDLNAPHYRGGGYRGG